LNNRRRLVEPREVLFGVGTDPGQVSGALSDLYAVQSGPPSSGRRICLDSVDWRLHNAGLALSDTRQGRHRALELSGRGRDRLTARAPAHKWPNRIDVLPDSPVRDHVASAVGVRALLPLAEVGTRSIGLRVLDDDDKTRVRLRIEQQRLVGDRPTPLPLRVLISPLRGYERDGQRCLDLLREAMPAIDDFGDASVAAFAAAGHTPGQPAVPPVRLDPDAPAPQSLAIVLRRWIDVIEAVRPGVLADIDPEYLHELRTSVRGTRSLLRLSVGLVPEDELTRFEAEFAWLGRLSAPLRDLDVSLLELAGRGSSNLTGLDELDPLRRYLAGKRRHALTELRAGLQSPRGTALNTEWRTTLDRVPALEPAGVTTRSAATSQARRAYRRIVKAAVLVTDETHPDQLHRLRRRCKAMRYLLDAYASVYAPRPQRQVLSALKALQDCLGEIQDVDVQRRHLSEDAATLGRRGTDVDSLLAIGALRDRILGRDTAARQTLARRLERFCSAQTRSRVVGLGTVDV
jgi:CHAD domain-containing protein